VIRFALRDLLGRKFRAILTSLAIVLGVAMVSGTYVLTDTIEKAFDNLFKDSYANTSVVVGPKKVVDFASSGTAIVPEELLARIKALPDVDAAVGGITDYARLIDTDGKPDVILIGTGSEVGLALSAREELAGEGIKARVVSMPCSELFDRQPQAYRDEVLPPSIKPRVAIEQASTLGWHRYVGDGGAIVGMHTFGASAPLKELVKKFGFTPDAVADVARTCVAAARGHRDLGE